ncbi:conserved protein of unknown function [Petrocella atlantisensis]|uniref:Recombinase family protein n=1 Tax=Petrocella atlantisensis TaxID=2173034 RepID=A0A3P7P1P4_9FIRM|nr:recombinase family protein [Petrocella atlantisensis]VDN49304.1 conserved protein of unknown function [Petrocella atlantisensis]
MEIEEIKAIKPSWGDTTIPKEKIRVAAYCRVSKDDSEQLLSYESQQKHYLNLIKEKPDWELTGIYADVITGTQVTKRIDFQRLIDDALDGKVDMIITKSIARFARNTFDTLKYVRQLKESGIAVFFEKENINTMTMDGELLLAILSSVAQQEVENISANVKKGLKMKMKRGEIVGFQGCLGYEYDKETKQLSINHTEAEIVKYIFKRYIAGNGATIISRELNEQGLKTKLGNTWKPNSVLRIIKNEKYIGDMLLGKSFTIDPIGKRRIANHGEEDQYYVKNHHEPIINRETFEKAQEFLNKRSYNRMPRGSNVKREKYSRKYAFSSMLECGFCGGRLTRSAWHTNTKYRKVVWHCHSNSSQGKMVCEHSKGIPEDIIENAFLKSFSLIVNKKRNRVDEVFKKVETTLGSDTATKKMKTLQKQLYDIELKKKKLINLLLEEKIEKELLETSLLELGEKETSLKDSIDMLTVQLEHEVEFNERINTFKQVVQKNASLKNFDREIFESLIEKVIIGSIDDDGIIDPYKITFIYKTGSNNTVDGSKYRKDGRKKKSDALSVNKHHDTDVLPVNKNDDTCGDM